MLSDGVHQIVLPLYDAYVYQVAHHQKLVDILLALQGEEDVNLWHSTTKLSYRI